MQYFVIFAHSKEKLMNIAIVKYNAGNIYSVDYALKRLGVEAIITSDKEMLMKADKVIFPGVGGPEYHAFGT